MSLSDPGSGARRLCLLACLLAVAGCSQEIRSEDVEERADEPARLATPSASPAADGGFRTHLYAERDADVYSRLQDGTGGEAGLPVRAIRAEIGDRVAADQMLALLEDAEAELAVQSARADAEEAAHRYERMKELVAGEMVSREAYEKAMYAHQRARAALERARLELARTRIRAPFPGVVSRRYVREGELVHRGDPLFRVTQMRPLRARLLVPEQRSDEFEEGNPVLVIAPDDRRDTARVVVVSPSVDPASGTREVIVELSDPDRFRPGQSVVVRLPE